MVLRRLAAMPTCVVQFSWILKYSGFLPEIISMTAMSDDKRLTYIEASRRRAYLSYGKRREPAFCEAGGTSTLQSSSVVVH